MINVRAFVEANPKLVTHRESERYPGLFVVKYTRKVFYDALWTPELEECRGLVVDKHWNPVIVPFKKIYNRGENGTDFNLDDRVTAVKKINGFMAAATLVPGHGVVVSTTGSLDSPFVALAEKWLRPNITDWIAANGGRHTWLFEICDPSDPHIIKEEPGAYLIGARQLDGFMMPENFLDDMAVFMDAKRPQVWYRDLKFSTVLELAKQCHHEGYVVHSWGDFLQPKSLKIKSPYYLVTKFLARQRADKFLERIDNIPALRQTIDEEYYPLLDYLAANKEYFASLQEAERISYIRNFLERT